MTVGGTPFKVARNNFTLKMREAKTFEVLSRSQITYHKCLSKVYGQQKIQICPLQLNHKDNVFFLSLFLYMHNVACFSVASVGIGQWWLSCSYSITVAFTQVFSVDFSFSPTQAELRQSLCMNTGVCYDVQLLTCHSGCAVFRSLTWGQWTSHSNISVL